MGLPPGDPSPPPNPPEQPDLSIVEAGERQDRTCADCGKKTARWKPVRRQGTSVVLCDECANRAPGPMADGEACPSCGAGLRPADRFCGKCGARIEYACTACGAAIEPEDAFCGKCGAQVA